MIKLIGFKRAIILGVLLAINIVLACAYLFAFQPMQMDALAGRDGVTAEISDLQSRIQNVKQEIELFNQNLPKYQALQGRGFFLEQDRFRLGRDLDAARVASGVKAFSYNVANIADVPNADATANGQKLILSRIDITNPDLVTDVEFYQFLDTMLQQFPAHLRLNAFHLRRSDTLREETLKMIAAGQPAYIMQGDAVFDWMTMVPIAAPAAPGTPGATP